MTNLSESASTHINLGFVFIELQFFDYEKFYSLLLKTLLLFYTIGRIIININEPMIRRKSRYL